MKKGFLLAVLVLAFGIIGCQVDNGAASVTPQWVRGDWYADFGCQIHDVMVFHSLKVLEITATELAYYTYAENGRRDFHNGVGIVLKYKLMAVPDSDYMQFTHNVFVTKTKYEGVDGIRYNNEDALYGRFSYRKGAK